MRCLSWGPGLILNQPEALAGFPGDCSKNVDPAMSIPSRPLSVVPGILLVGEPNPIGESTNIIASILNERGSTPWKD